MSVYLPPPRYSLAVTDRQVQIMQAGRAIATANGYYALAPSECARMVAQANMAGELVTCLRWITAAVTTAEAQGQTLGRHIIAARDRANQALAKMPT